MQLDTVVAAMKPVMEHGRENVENTSKLKSHNGSKQNRFMTFDHIEFQRKIISTSFVFWTLTLCHLIALDEMESNKVEQ